jgi:hypothetical protein
VVRGTPSLLCLGGRLTSVQSVHLFFTSRHARVRALLYPKAAALRGVSTRVIYRCLEDGAIHFIETAKGQLFICLNTLVANAKN